MTLTAAALTALILAYTDLRTGRMPNGITVGSLALAVLVRWGLGGSLGLVSALLGALVVAFLPALLFFSTRGEGIGGGDVKALLALGAWLGPMQGLEAEFAGFCILAAYALVKEAQRGQLLSLLGRSFSLALPKRLRFSASAPLDSASLELSGPQAIKMRFGPALFLGTVAVVTTPLLPKWLVLFG